MGKDKKGFSQKEMKIIIKNWCEKTENEECVITKDEEDKEVFLFKYDGFIYEILWEGNYPCHMKEFEDLFEGTGWWFDFECPSVIMIFKEARK